MTMNPGILHLRAYANTARRPFYASAVFVNTVGISLPVIALASLLPFGILASRYMDDAMETSAQVEVVLSNGAAAWETNPTPDNAQIHLAATLLFEFAEHLAAFQHKFKVFFAVLAAWCGFLGFAFVAVAIRYLHDLNTCISEMRGRTKTGVETFSRTWRWYSWFLHVFTYGTQLTYTNCTLLGLYSSPSHWELR